MTDSVLIKRIPAPFAASIDPPGSKSHANRAIVAACLGRGEVTIQGATPCDDVAVLVENLRRMGFDVMWRDRAAGTVVVRGGIPTAGAARDAAIELDCALAGTALRFLTAVACVVPGRFVITGNARMRERPIGPLVDALRELGAEAEAPDGCPPVVVGERLAGAGGACAASLDPSISSQFLSALLLVGGALPSGLDVTLTAAPSSRGYVELTRRTLGDFGIEVALDDLAPGATVRVRPGPAGASRPSAYAVERDWSSVGAFHVLRRITGGTITHGTLARDTAQGDAALPAALDRLDRPGDATIDMTEMPDQVMNVAVFAAHRTGRTAIRGASNLRYKETDRLAVLTGELTKAGVDITAVEDGVDVCGPATLTAATLDPHGDHRMAMAFAILGATSGLIRITDPGCVSKSYPAFFDDLAALSAPANRRRIVLIGMRATGKSTLARDLADALGRPVEDSDERVVDRFGPIAAMVEAEGWPAFRAREAGIIDELLTADASRGAVIALGGGAIETEAVRRRLADPIARPLVFWLDEPLDALRSRIAADGGVRPSLTGATPADELATVYAARADVYRASSDERVPPGLTRAERVDYIASALERMTSFGARR